MGRVYQGAVYILPADVKPREGGDWAEGIVITPEERDATLAIYDGLVERDKTVNRRFFPISEEGIDRLFKKSDSERIMLQVENIDKPDEIFIEWMSYERSFFDLSKFDYFIFDRQYWDRVNPPTIPNGIKGSIGAVIVAAMGKSESGSYHIIINSAVCFLVNNPEKVGGDPPGAGTKIPTN